FVPQNDTNTLYVEATFGLCTPSTRVAVTVYRQGYPNGFAQANDTTLCSSGSATLIATTKVPASTIRWWNAFTGGVPIATGTSYTTPSLSNTTTYYVDFTSATCNARARKPVVVNVID